MKKQFLFKASAMLFLGSALVFSLLTSCEGPAGIPGKDGVDANTACLKCHTSAKMNTLQAEYQLSKHYLGTTSARNGKYCARCHTSEGFMEITASGKFVVASDILPSTRIGCETCHKHSGFDFQADTAADVLRTTSPVTLEYEKNLVAKDFGQINNLCITCHQIRGATSVSYLDSLTDSKSKAFDQLPFFPFKADKVDTDPVNYQVGQSFAVHDGNQSNLFAGINGYEYSGKTYTRTWKHSDNSCVDCHMNEYNATTKTGGHTLWVNEEACVACHGAGTTKVQDVQALVETKRIALAELLVARKVFKKTTNATTGAVSYSAVQTHDFKGTLYETVSSTTKYASLTNNNSVDPKTSVVKYENVVTYAIDKDFATRIGRPWKMGELGAAYNYAYINSELSLGAHNPIYAKQLLDNSIEWLNAHP
jgi:hypothetical protein